MHSAISSTIRSSRLPNHRSRRFVSRHRVLLLPLVLMAALLAINVCSLNTSASKGTGARRAAATESVSGAEQKQSTPVSVLGSITNAQRAGNHAIIIRTTENSWGKADASFRLGLQPAPTLGNYPNKTISLSGAVTVTPDAVPTNTTRITVSTSTDFKGTFAADLATGKVLVTNAHPLAPTPPGFYTVTVTAFDSTGATTTRTFTLTVTTPVPCNPLTFATAANFGASGWSVAVGDFNGDGNQDIVAAGSNGVNGVSVLLGDGAGGFGAATYVGVAFSVAVVLGDFNGDGKQDLATVNQTLSTVSVLLGDGAGSFSAPTSFNVGTTPVSAAMGDFNRDGKLDLAVVNQGSNTVSVLLGDGAGSLGAATNFNVGSNPTSAAVGDFNGDGNQDLAVANFSSDNVSILVGNGAGSFSAATNFGAFHSRALAVGDFNGDGKQDLVTASDNNAASVLLGNGAGSFGAVNQFSAGGTPDGVAVGDFNGDGNQDLAVANFGSADVSVLLGNGTGSFSATTNFGAQFRSTSVAVGDFNGDGKQDLAVANRDTESVSVLLRNCPKANQTITFGALANKAVGDPDFLVSATASSGLTVSFAAAGQCTISGNTVHITGAGSCTITASQAGDSNYNAAANVAQSFTIGNSTEVTLSQSNYNLSESTGFVTVTVNRTGDLSVPVTVDYATNDTGAPLQCGMFNTLASARCDFGLSLGTLRFAATETQKTFVIPITQDSYTEGPEVFTVKLSNLTGSGAGLASPSSATVTINDSASPTPNAIDDTGIFVRQQYRDFLNRDADAPGLAFWKDNIDQCNDAARRPAGWTVAQCIEVRRIDTTAAFFLSIEFQQTGNLVRSFYVAGLNRPATNNMPAFVEFERDAQGMQMDVIVGQGNWQQTLSDNRDAFMREFVARTEFNGLYPTTDTPTQYVDKLYLHAGITPTSSERGTAITEFGAAATAADAGARGRALFDVTQNTTFQTREINRSFVQMEYFGYLRRNPNDAPDGNFVGYDFWLNKLNAAGGNYISSEMVKAFLSSIEYRQRFGP